MELRREHIKRPMYDFTKATGTVSAGESITEADLLRLIDYMKSYNLKLGLDFSFIMGYDAPGRKFNVATTGPSLMHWYDYSGKHDDDEAHEQAVQLCIKYMKSEQMKSDHLEVWPKDGDEEPPFYVGQSVVGSDEVLPESRIKKGEPYTIRICHYAECKGNWFWYVGIEELPDHDWLAPRLFKAK